MSNLSWTWNSFCTGQSIAHVKEEPYRQIIVYDIFKGGDSLPTRLPMPPPGFDDLPISDKLAYVQLLWERIALEAEQLSVPDWHKQVLRERLRGQEATEEGSLDWDFIRNRVKEELEKKGSG